MWYLLIENRHGYHVVAVRGRVKRPTHGSETRHGYQIHGLYGRVEYATAWRDYYNTGDRDHLKKIGV